jgi:hypothetical protein
MCQFVFKGRGAQVRFLNGQILFLYPSFTQPFENG